MYMIDICIYIYIERERDILRMFVQLQDIADIAQDTAAQLPIAGPRISADK